MSFSHATKEVRNRESQGEWPAVVFNAGNSLKSPGSYKKTKQNKHQKKNPGGQTDSKIYMEKQISKNSQEYSRRVEEGRARGILGLASLKTHYKAF